MSRTNPAEQLTGPPVKSAQSYSNLLIFSELYGDLKKAANTTGKHTVNQTTWFKLTINKHFYFPFV